MNWVLIPRYCCRDQIRPYGLLASVAFQFAFVNRLCENILLLNVLWLEPLLAGPGGVTPSINRLLARSSTWARGFHDQLDQLQKLQTARHSIDLRTRQDWIKVFTGKTGSHFGFVPFRARDVYSTFTPQSTFSFRAPYQFFSTRWRSLD